MSAGISGRVLVIAGSDSGGGAGIQADIKTIQALEGYGMTAITALTAQNTHTVTGIYAVPPEFVTLQIETVLEDIGAESIKTGMLLNAPIIRAVVAALKKYPHIPAVIDPVMVSTSGAMLLEEDGVEALKVLLGKAALVTPNLPEAEVLTGIAIQTEQDVRKAGEKLLRMGARAVLIKDGHGEGDMLTDRLITAEGMQNFPIPRRRNISTHGTGCTLASAIAVSLAQGLTLPQAVQRAQTYVQQAIANAPGFGRGKAQPLGHRIQGD